MTVQEILDYEEQLEQAKNDLFAMTDDELSTLMDLVMTEAAQRGLIEQFFFDEDEQE